MQLQLIFEFD